MKYAICIMLVFLILAPKVKAQDKDLDRLETGELKMTLPSIYFKHNSTDYTSMPYQVDSCFQYIAHHIKDINDLVIWRDTLETEKLTSLRIRKLKAELIKRKVSGIHIQSMREKQKISRLTINTTADSAHIKYLMTLNSVFEVARTRELNNQKSMHGLWLFGTCYKCVFGDLLRGYWLSKQGREHCRMDRRRQQANEKKHEKKTKRHLVWTSWKHGFHWSDHR